MLIGVDGNEANVQDRVGVNVYAFELLRSINQLQLKGEINHNLIVYLKNHPGSDMPKETESFKYNVLSGGKLWILTRLMPHLFLGSPKPDIFFSPSHYSPPFAPMERVCSIMDLGYLENSEQFKKIVFWQLKYWTAISIFISKAIIAISNSTKKDIVRHYPSASKKVFVTHLAYDKGRFNKDVPKEDVRRTKEKYHIVGDYILFLSTLKPSKNVIGLINAFKGLNNSFSETKLVIAGKKGWMYEEIFKKVKDLNLEDKIIFTDFVSEEDKPALIAGAEVFVLPSFWEGFGLDVLSALAVGVPVVASDIGSIPEVAGDAAIYIDPYNIDSIKEGIEKVLSLNEKEYNSLREKGFSQASKFSWEKTARETIKIIENVSKR